MTLEAPSVRAGSIHSIKDEEILVEVITIGKREDMAVYKETAKRLLKGIADDETA